MAQEKKYKKASKEPPTEGKIPPQAIDLEKVVLGAVMLERGAMAEVLDILKPDTFYKTAHQIIFSAMLALDGKSHKIDILTVTEQLIKSGQLEEAGGPYYITTLTNDVVSSANILDHARIIVEKHMKRRIIEIGSELVVEGYDLGMDAFELLDNAEKRVTDILNGNDRGKYSSLDQALVKSVHRIEHMRTLNTSLTGVPSGYADLDKITHGWQPTDLIVLAARPSVGKTALAMNFARNAAMNLHGKVPTALFSLEMSTGQITDRMLAAETGIFLSRISTGQLSDQEMSELYDKGISKLSHAPVFIDDTPALNIFELRAKCRRLKNKHQLGLIILDYLQLMSGTGEGRNGNREQEISRISRDLKGLAKELQVPIIALSQLSRAVESRKDGEKIPQLSDLRESGAIEQDADLVIFIYRPEYYGLDAGAANKGETHIKIAKHRSGALETVKLTAKLEIQKFVDFEGGFEAPAQTGSWRPVKHIDFQGDQPLF